MLKLLIFLTFLKIGITFPPAISFSPYKFTNPIESQHHSICKYCLCDQHEKSVICAGTHILINTVHLPSWTKFFYIHNITLNRMPHFGYSPNLKILRINYCKLSYIHPLNFVPLPNLETIHLSDNELIEFPETLVSRLDKLRILNLARNKFYNLSNIELSLSNGLILEQLVLDDNPIKYGFNNQFKLPLTRQLHMSNTRISKINGSHIIFEASPMCTTESCRSVEISPNFWSHLITADFSKNTQLNIHPSTMPLLANLTALNLAETHLPVGLSTLFHPGANLRHLDLHGAKLDQQILDHWHYCSERLEWLDISNLNLQELNLGSSCTSLQWLFVSRNNMKKARIDSRGLRVLHIDSNELSSWPFPTGTSMMRQLETLHFGNNRLKSLPIDALKGFISLTTLDLSDNKLTEIQNDLFSSTEWQLRHLNLSFNLLIKIPSLNLPKLQILDLSANDLNSMGLNTNTFQKMQNLQHLHVSKNPGLLDECIEDFNDENFKYEIDTENTDTVSSECWLDSLKNLKNLVELDLSECDIKSLPSLNDFDKLQSLNLKENEINEIDYHQLPPNLMHLNLRNNRIHFIGNLSSAPFIEHLQDLNLGENPLHCECSVFSVLRYLKRQPDYDDRSMYYCFAENWQHPLKSYLDSAENYCKDNTSYGPSFWAILANFVGLFITCITVAFVFAFILFKAYKAVDCKIATYTPVPQDTPVDL